MSRTLTPPMALIPIGIATFNGQQIEVRQHPEFVRFFFDLFNRVGGNNSKSLQELSDLLDAERLGVFEARQAPDQPADIAYIDAFSRRPEQAPEPFSIPNIAAFMPRPQEQSTPFAEASAVLCSRVFAAR
jgi:hypothetical protein